MNQWIKVIMLMKHGLKEITLSQRGEEVVAAFDKYRN